ncbi:tyrosine-type recombinase/integrase [Salegentibacter salegens]|uniref:Phage integrase family protein n=1 Tax=Salegentibacter salegens TaxID=143223 RepID=A0A1M7J8J4_9FLAO|nr:tyrosine-type recombinase/integrase [Salegentibacter salegens]PRX47315.1 phage integrase family protein [Salegentibacter salegens]SHM49339.1 Phage integrase family protein [Salegentibacter salegens]
MASIKVVRRKNKERNDGTAPLALRISKNYATNYCFLGQYVLEKDWDNKKGIVKKSYPNSQRLNNYLRVKLTEANNVSFQNNDSISSKEMKKKIVGFKVKKSFFFLASERIEQKYDQEVFSVAKSELSTLYNIEEFLNLNKSINKEKAIEAIMQRRKDRISRGRNSKNPTLDGVFYFKKNKRLSFQDINMSFINRYKTFCTAYLGQKTRTVTNQLIFIRTMFNAAIKDGIVDPKYYPFAGDKEKIKLTSGNKIGLNINEIECIELLELEEDSTIWHTKNIWLLAFYFAGIRISDILKLKWSDFKDDRLYYIMNKNEKPLSLKIPIKAKSILYKYEKERSFNENYIFPFLRNADPKQAEDIYRKTKNSTKQLNKYLKVIGIKCGITKNLSNHIARHSFGNMGVLAQLCLLLLPGVPPGEEADRVELTLP